MAYIIERSSQFYVVAYDGIDPRTNKERRRWHAAGRSRADAEAIAERLTVARVGPPQRTSAPETPTALFADHRVDDPFDQSPSDGMKNWIDVVRVDSGAVDPEFMDVVQARSAELVDIALPGGRQPHARQLPRRLLVLSCRCPLASRGDRRRDGGGRHRRSVWRRLDSRPRQPRFRAKRSLGRSPGRTAIGFRWFGRSVDDAPPGVLGHLLHRSRYAAETQAVADLIDRCIERPRRSRRPAFLGSDLADSAVPRCSPLFTVGVVHGWYIDASLRSPVVCTVTVILLMRAWRCCPTASPSADRVRPPGPGAIEAAAGAAAGSALPL